MARPSNAERHKSSRNLCLDNLGGLWPPMELRKVLDEHVSNLEVHRGFKFLGSSA